MRPSKDRCHTSFSTQLSPMPAGIVASKMLPPYSPTAWAWMARGNFSRSLSWAGVRRELGRAGSRSGGVPDNGFAAATRYFAFPKQRRATPCRDQRRTRAVGAFPDRASALRLVTAVVLHATAIWSDRRYLDMDLLTVNDKELHQAA